MKKTLILKCIVLCICITTLSLKGCNTRELEDRGFPLAIGIDKNEDKIVVSFDFPNLSKTSENKNPGGEAVSFSVEAGTYYEAQKAYENNTNKVLDYNHLKAIILSQEFLADRKAVEDLLSWLEHEEVVARNTCLFVAKDSSAEILTLTGQTNGSVGKYLEQMLETQEDFKENKVMTIGDLMNQRHNRNESLFIPVLTNNGGVPSITEYAVVDAFLYKGNISVENAMKAFLSQNLLQHFIYRLADGRVLEIQNINTNKVINGNEKQVILSVELTGTAQIKNGKKAEETEKKKIEKHLNQQLEISMTEAGKELLIQPGVDMTNSFSMLGGYERELYRKFRQDYEGYRRSLKIDFSANVKLINE